MTTATTLHMDTNEQPAWARNLPKLLRALGASAVLFSLYTFLFKGWEGSTDLIRYGMLLAHTCLLAVLALGSGHFFKEGKGPRLMMMLALVSVPINFAILGAFIASGSAVAMQQVVPSYVFWSIDSLSTALMTAVVATALLVPVIILAFRTLARSLSKHMNILFIVANVLLLIPIRDAVFASVIPMMVAIITLFFSAKTARERTESKTFEGMIALLLMFLPSGIMLGRDLWLHHQDTFMVATAGLMTCIVLRHVWFVVRELTFIRTICELLGIIVSLLTGLAVTASLIDMGLYLSLASCIGALAGAALIYEISTRKTQLSTLYRFIAFVMLLLVTGINLAFADGMSASVFSMVLGLALVVGGYRAQTKSLLLAGIALFLGGIIIQGVQLIAHFDFSYWPVLAGGGMTAIVLASLIESRGNHLKQRVSHYKNNYAEWAF